MPFPRRFSGHILFEHDLILHVLFPDQSGFTRVEGLLVGKCTIVASRWQALTKIFKRSKRLCVRKIREFSIPCDKMRTTDAHRASSTIVLIVEEGSPRGRQTIFIELDVQNRLYEVRLNPLIPEHPVHKTKYDWAPPRARLEVIHFHLFDLK